MAKPYGLANQKLCYFQIYKILEKKKGGECFWELFVDEYRPRLPFNARFSTILKWNTDPGYLLTQGFLPS